MGSGFQEQGEQVRPGSQGGDSGQPCVGEEGSCLGTRGSLLARGEGKMEGAGSMHSKAHLGGAVHGGLHSTPHGADTYPGQPAGAGWGQAGGCRMPLMGQPKPDPVSWQATSGSWLVFCPPLP